MTINLCYDPMIDDGERRRFIVTIDGLLFDRDFDELVHDLKEFLEFRTR